MKRMLQATAQCVAALFVCVVAGLVFVGCPSNSKTVYYNSTTTTSGAATLVLKVQGSNAEVGASYEVAKNSTTTFVVELREGTSTRQLAASEVNFSQSPDPSTAGTFGGNLTFVSNNVNGNVDVTISLASNSAVSKTVQLRVVDTPNNATNTTTGQTGLVFKVGTLELGSTYQVAKNSTTTFVVMLRETSGTTRALSVSEVTIAQNPNQSPIGTFGGNFTFLSNNTNGDVDITLTLVSNTSLSKTIRIQVVDTPVNTNTGTTTTSAGITGIQITPDNQQAIAAHQPRKINALINVGFGLQTVSSESLPFWRVSSEPQLVARQCVVDAAGIFRGAVANSSFNVEVHGVGGQVTGGQATEQARKTTSSNVLIISTDSSQPAGLILFAPAFMTAGMDYRPTAKNGTVDITNDPGLNMTSSDTNVVMVTTDGAGQRVFRSLRDGLVTITMTFSGQPDYTHRLRVTNDDPFRQQFNSQFVVDTHASHNIMPDPTDTNVTNPTRYVVVRVLNLSKCASVTPINAADHPSPLDFPSVGSLDGQSAPSFDLIYTDADGVVRGVSRKVFTNPTGTVDMDPLNYAGKSKSPIANADYSNGTLWSFAQDLSQSHFYDSYASGNTNLVTQMQLPANLSPANVWQTNFVRHDRP